MAGEPRSVAKTIAAAIPEIMGSGQHAAAVEEIDQVPEAARLPILSLVQSRIKMQRRDYAPAIELSAAVLRTVEQGSEASDYALLNLVTLHMQAGLGDHSGPIAKRLRETTSNEQLRLIADGAKLMIDATTDGNIPALATHLRAMAERQRGVHPHYFGVTMLNLAIETISQDQPGLAIELADQAIDALEETSSRIEMAAALMAKGYALALLGRLDDAHTL